MECSRNKKRGFEQSDAAALNFTESKRPKLPTLASVVVEALKVDSLQRLCSSLEPLFRRIVSEEVERALTRLGHSQLAGRSTPPRIRATGGRNLRLEFKTRMPPHLFTGGKVEGEQGAAIHVVLIDHTTGLVITTGPESSAKLDIVVLEGDFSEEDDDDWTKEHFENHEVKARQGKRPLLTGDLQVTLKEGIGTLGELSFSDNSSWIRSRKFRLGAKVAPGYCDEVHVREGRTEAFAVKDHRGELYKKHYPPALHDEVWRLDRIAKDGALHKKLIQADIVTVEDFLRLLVRDQQKLRNILGSAMSNRMWENTVEHAKTCVFGEKLYIYYADETHSTGVVFNHIYELRGLLADGQFHSLESLDHTQKISVDLLVRRAYENWNRVVEYDNKVLSSLSNNKKATKSLPPIANNISDRDSYSNSMQITRSRTDENGSSFPPSMELQFSGASATTVQTLNHHNHDHHPPQQLGMIPDSSGYLSVATLGGTYFSQEHHAPAQIGQGLEDFFEEEVRVRSTEMLQCDDMQKLLRSFTMGGAGGICYAEENGCSYGTPCENHQIYRTVQKEHERGSGKAVVGWLKLKAALRWGIFIRKQAAERRAQLVEL